MESIDLPGFSPEETAFLHSGVLIIGDALINLEPEGLRLLPEEYSEEKKQLFRSLATLQNLKPQVLLFAHGNLIAQSASDRLANCMKTP